MLLFFTSAFSQNQVDNFSKYSYKELQQLINTHYSKNESSKVKQISLYYLNKAKKEKNKDEIAEGYVYASFSEELPDALKYMDSLEIFSKNLQPGNAYPARVYLIRGNLYFKNDNQKKALENYVKGLEYAKKKGNRNQIEFVETQIAYLNNYIGKHQEAANSLNNLLHNSKELSGLQKQEIHLNLANTYLDMNKLDSAKVMIADGIEIYSNDKNSRFYNAYLSSYGVYNLKAKNYQNAIDNFNNCIDFFFKGDDKREINYTLMYLGKSYVGLGNEVKAIENFSKLDSLVKKNNYTFPELKNAYAYLIDYYKNKKDKERQLYFVERLIEVNKHLDDEFRHISIELPKQYDTPQLLEQKEILLGELKKRKLSSIVTAATLSLVLVFSIILYYRTKRQEKKYKIRAQELLQHLEELKNIENTAPLEINNENSKVNRKVTKTVPEKIYSSIIKELENFENQKLFLQKGITIVSLSKDFNTNTAYLSDVINSHKNKSFPNYLNDLRIDYAIQQLAVDKKLRSYKIISIAEELGYNNEQAFSLAFKKKTGTTVSAYIKEINT